MRRSQSANKYSQETRTGTNRSKLPERRRNFTLENSASEATNKVAPVTVGSSINKSTSSKQNISSHELSSKQSKPSSVELHLHRESNVEQKDSKIHDSNLSSNSINMKQSNDESTQVTASSVLLNSSPLSVEHEVSTPLVPPLDLRKAITQTIQNSEYNNRSERELKMEKDKMHTPHKQEEALVNNKRTSLSTQRAATQRAKRTQPTNLFSMEVETSPLSVSQLHTEGRSDRTQKLTSTKPQKRSASSSFTLAHVTKAKNHITRYANTQHTSEHKSNVSNPSLMSAEHVPWSLSTITLISSSNSSSLQESASTLTRNAEHARAPFQRVHTHNSYLSTTDNDHITQVETHTHQTSLTQTPAQRWSPRGDLVITPRPASTLYKMLFPVKTSTQQNYSGVYSSPDARARANINYQPHHIQYHHSVYNKSDDESSDNFTAECYSQPMIPVAHIRIRPLLPNLRERNDQRKVFLLDHQHLLICSSSTLVAHAFSETNNSNINSKSITSKNSPLKCSQQEVRETVQEEEHESHKLTRPKPEVNKIRYKEINKSLYSSVKQKTLACSTPRPVASTRTNVTPQKSNNSINKSSKTSDAVASGIKMHHQQKENEKEKQQRHHFTFEFIHDEDAAQQDVFEESVLPFVDEALMGHNVAICCYGPTGSGKTYSMIGESNEMPLTYRNVRNLNKEWKKSVSTQRERVNVARCKRSASASVVVLAHRDKLNRRVASTRSRSSAAWAEIKPNITKSEVEFNNDNMREEEEWTRGENVEMASDVTNPFAESSALSESDVGILPRLVLVLLERRNKPQYIIRESQSTLQTASSTNSENTDKEMTLKLMLTNITFYGVELYLDDLCNLLDPEKRTLSTNALSDIGGVSTLCAAIDKEWQEWCEVNEINVEPMQTQRQASLEKPHVKSHRVNVNDSNTLKISSSPSSFMQNFSAFSSSNNKKKKMEMKEKEMHTPPDVCSRDNANVSVVGTTSPSRAGSQCNEQQIKNARESSNTSESPPAKEPLLETHSNNYNNICDFATPRAQRRKSRKESRQGGITINSLTDLHLACELARVNRTTSRHALNDTSSRSHALYVLRLDFDLSQEHNTQNDRFQEEEKNMQHQVNNTNLREGQVMQSEHFSSYVTLVDLAGSERVKETNVRGKEMKEAQYINKSLSALSNVVLALYQRSAHVPYRDSKLTRLLRPCLSEGRVLVLVHVAPCNAHNESVQTLKFADQIRHAKVQAHKSSSNISNHPVNTNQHGTNTRKNQDVCVGNFTRLAGIAVRSKHTKTNATGNNDKKCNEECDEESAALHQDDVRERQLLETFAELTQNCHSGMEEEMIRHTEERDAICADLRIFTANQVAPFSNRDVNTSNRSESVKNNTTERSDLFEESRNNDNTVKHNIQIQELLTRYVEHCVFNSAHESIELIESQLEQANAMHIAECQRKWNDKITMAEEELEECVKVNRTLKSEAMTPLPLDPYVNQLIHETQACDSDLESIMTERDQLRGLVALLRQRLSTHEDLLRELEREENEIQLLKGQQTRLIRSATQPISISTENMKNIECTSMDEWEREASPLNISFTSSSVSSVITDDSVHETSYSYNNTNSDNVKPSVLHSENRAHVVSMPRAKMLSASWRHVLADQLRLAKQMSLLRTEVECFHHTDDIYEGLWARLMRLEMLLAVQVQNAVLESVLREPNLLRLVCTKNKALYASTQHLLSTTINQNKIITQMENKHNVEMIARESEEQQKRQHEPKTTESKNKEVKEDNVNVKTPHLETAAHDHSNNISEVRDEQMINPLNVLYNININNNNNNDSKTNTSENNSFSETSSKNRNVKSINAADYNNEEVMQRLCLQQMMINGVECEMTFQLHERSMEIESICNELEHSSDKIGSVDRRACTCAGRLKLCKCSSSSSSNKHHGYTLEFWCLARNIHCTTSSKLSKAKDNSDEYVCAEQSSSSSSSFSENTHKYDNNMRVKEYLSQGNNSNNKQSNVNSKETINRSKIAKINDNIIKSKQNDLQVKLRNVYTQQERQRQQLHKYNYTTMTNVNKTNTNKNVNRQNVKTASLTKANVEAKILQNKLSNKQVITRPDNKQKMKWHSDDDDSGNDVEICIFTIPLSDHRMELQLHIVESETDNYDNEENKCLEERASCAKSTLPQIVLIVNYAKCFSKWDRHWTNHFTHHIQLISGNKMILPLSLANSLFDGISHKGNNGEGKHEHDLKGNSNANSNWLHECINPEQVMELIIRFPLCIANKASSVFTIEQIVYALSAVCLPRTDMHTSSKKGLENKMFNKNNNDEDKSFEDKYTQYNKYDTKNSTCVKLPNHIPYVLLCHDTENEQWNNNATKSTSILYTVPTEFTEHKEPNVEQKTNQSTFTVITTSSARGRRQRHLPFVSQIHAADNYNIRTDKSPSPEIDEDAAVCTNLNTHLLAQLRRPIKSAQLEIYLHLLHNKTQSSEMNGLDGVHYVICQLASLLFFLHTYFFTNKNCKDTLGQNESQNLQFYYKYVKCVMERMNAATRQIQRYIKQQIFDAEDIKGEEMNNCSCSDGEQHNKMEHHSHINDVITDARKGIGLIFSSAHDENEDNKSVEHVRSSDSANYDDFNKQHKREIVTTSIKCHLTISELRHFLSLRVHWTIWHWAYYWKDVMHVCNEQDKQMQLSNNTKQETNEVLNDVDNKNCTSLQALFRQHWEEFTNTHVNSSCRNRNGKDYDDHSSSCTSHDSDIDDECDYLVDLGSEQFWHLLVEYIHKADNDNRITETLMECITLPQVELAALPDYLHLTEEHTAQTEKEEENNTTNEEIEKITVLS